MKPLAALLIAAALCGCRPQITPEGRSLPRQQSEAIAAGFGPAGVLCCWSNAVRGASNQAELEARFGTMADVLAVEFLTRQSGGELARRLDTVLRGTSKSPYTEAQILAARRAKGLE